TRRARHGSGARARRPRDGARAGSYARDRSPRAGAAIRSRRTTAIPGRVSPARRLRRRQFSYPVQPTDAVRQFQEKAATPAAWATAMARLMGRTETADRARDDHGIVRQGS